VTEYYLDASALVKRDADEPGSTWIRYSTDPQAPHMILLAEVTLVEVAAALAAILVAADGDLLAAATAERLPLENPLNHLQLDPQAAQPEPDMRG
jgi:hypothetical protein